MCVYYMYKLFLSANSKVRDLLQPNLLTIIFVSIIMLTQLLDLNDLSLKSLGQYRGFDEIILVISKMSLVTRTSNVRNQNIVI